MEQLAQLGNQVLTGFLFGIGLMLANYLAHALMHISVCG